jgi:8-oxo-dGTP pyrophosphatase MutT (NUDIX family)
VSYKITAGIDEEDLPAFINSALEKYGTYQGQAVNYTKADLAPVVMCTIVHDNKIFLAKRGYGLADAEGYWSTVNGFIDEIKPVKEFAQQEIKEELGIAVKLYDIKVGKSYTLENPKDKRRYIVFPCLVELNFRPKVKLDREHTEFAWITRDELESYEILDDLFYAVDAALSIR